ncbi:hypothetical protein [Apilactobacillus xinyiensis]|uniref:hypothetical protein n=1 Tax=Apilactobacillus xinyiensis TaxID=2841032 RepID=UPI00200E6FFD|nr:hypothetical protein [Apilactobacillus xinyiensis]MCL0330841.1 hypothetical protein [Apilactobacillus xinyiensis]
MVVIKMSSNARIRSQQLITGIINDRNFINSLYDSAQGNFKSYLMRFFNAENTDGTLSVSELRRNVSSKDYDLFRNVLNQFSKPLVDDEEGALRLDKAKKIAGLDKQNLLNAITAIIIASTSHKVSDYLGNSLINEYQYAINFQEREARATGYSSNKSYTNTQIMQQAKDLLAQKNYGLKVDQRVWIKNDKLTNQTNDAVNKGLMVGITQAYMTDKLFKEFTTSPNSVATIFNKTKNFYKNQLINQEKTRFGATAANDVFDRYQVSMLNWNLASTHSHSDACDDLAQGSPYAESDYPDQPHWGCVCFPSPAYKK